MLVVGNRKVIIKTDTLNPGTLKLLLESIRILVDFAIN